MKQEDIAQSELREVESPLVDLANAFRDQIEDLHDWERETERCAVVIAVDPQSDMASIGVVGAEKAIEIGLLTVIFNILRPESRERLAKAFVGMYEADKMEQAKAEAAARTQIPS
ncbi:MAG: hypothetical protein Q4A61_00745 [Porphyromonadaceae bacterium]|nr:hypothetical protein [Porphyromonadaceae bacterium]